MSSTVIRPALLVGALLALAPALTACSGGPGGGSSAAMKLSGNCSITDRALSPDRVISSATVKKLLGSGEWTATRGLSVSPQGTLQTAYVGSCGITPADATSDERLRIEVVPRSEPSFAEAQRALDAGAGITRIDDHTYTTGDPTVDSSGHRLDGAKGVLINPDYVLIVEILHPAEGVDARHEAGPTVRAVADNLTHLG